MLYACKSEYNISGDSSIQALDGRMLYLKVFTNNDQLHNLDSCEVIHGKFNFMGMIDSLPAWVNYSWTTKASCQSCLKMPISTSS